LMSTNVDLSNICVFRIWISHSLPFLQMRYKFHLFPAIVIN
jgi:hypothetical protein